MFRNRILERIAAESSKGVRHVSLSRIVNQIHKELDSNALFVASTSESRNRLPPNFTFPEEDLLAVLELVRRNNNIEALALDGLYLRHIPQTIGQITTLRFLDLSSNLLRLLPDSLGNLQRLELLDLRKNRLTSLPASLRSLPNLKELFLHNNDELAIPPEMLGDNPNPPSWEHYFSRDLQASEWYEAIRHDPQRASLIQEELQKSPCTNVGVADWLAAFQVAIDSIRADPISSTREHGRARAILDFYFETRRRRLNEAKVLLIGQGGVGKTSLVKRLVDNTFDDHEAKTEGIAIRQWSVATDEDYRIRSNIWDFGGQEIMHSTHQFFLTKRSLYVLVLDARAGVEQGNLHYWLEMIRVYGGDSPVLVVVNKCDEHYERLDEKRLRLDYESKVKLTWFHYLSCKTGKGVDEALESIRLLLCRMPHVSDWLPEDYFSVKRNLESRAAHIDFITAQEYAAICEQHGVKLPEDQRRLLRFLHDLGCVLHYDDPDQRYHFHDTRVLNPEWVTGGVYKILNDPVLLRKGDGVVKHSDLRELLHSNDDGRRRYPEHRHPFLMDMMRKYELCVDFPDDGAKVLVPELLSKNEPDAGWIKPSVVPGPSEFNTDVLDFQFHYTVLPRGLIPRFIVRTQHLLTEHPTVWRAGEVLDIEGCRVLIRGDVRVAKVFIQVQGKGAKSRRAALAVARNHMEAIHLTYGDLGAEAKVPLPRDPEAPPVDYSLLLRLEREGVREQFFEKAHSPYNICDLLNGVDERRFDVFLSHNSLDKPFVRDLASRLKKHDVRCWLDEEQLTPGEPWQREIAAAIRECRTIAVLIGPHAFGAWHKEEAGLGLDYAARGVKRTIPVLLPNVPKGFGVSPEFDFLAGRTWIKFENEYSDDEVRKLARAILDA